jgi:hypothetical protein
VGYQRVWISGGRLIYAPYVLNGIYHGYMSLFPTPAHPGNRKRLPGTTLKIRRNPVQRPGWEEQYLRSESRSVAIYVSLDLIVAIVSKF